MRAGKLRHQVTIQQATEVRNEYGEPEVTWTTLAIVWAAVEPLRGREMWAAREQLARINTRIRMRYLAGITPKMRVIFGDKTYLIETVINPEERNIEMQLICEELVDT